jgi:hypothetical protein
MLNAGILIVVLALVAVVATLLLAGLSRLR